MQFSFYDNAESIKQFLEPKKYDIIRPYFFSPDIIDNMDIKNLPEEINRYWQGIFEQDENLLREFYEFIGEDNEGSPL